MAIFQTELFSIISRASVGVTKKLKCILMNFSKTCFANQIGKNWSVSSWENKTTDSVFHQSSLGTRHLQGNLSASFGMECSRCCQCLPKSCVPNVMSFVPNRNARSHSVILEGRCPKWSDWWVSTDRGILMPPVSPFQPQTHPGTDRMHLGNLWEHWIPIPKLAEKPTAI